MSTINFHLVITKKGGGGKTSYVNALTNKAHKDDIEISVVDFDPTSKSAQAQLKWAKVGIADISDADGQIKHEKFEFFFDQCLEGDYNVYVADGGGNTSEQLVSYLQDPTNKEIFKEYAAEGINFHFHIIIAGGTGYTTCANYAEDILALTQDIGKRYLVINEYYDMTKEQLKDLRELSQNMSCKIRRFNLIDGNPEIMVNEVYGCISQGVCPIENVSRPTLRRLKRTLDNIEFDF